MLWLLYVQVALSALAGHKRSFRADALRTMTMLPVKVQVRGREYIPQVGPRLLTINHYFHPYVKTWWIPLGIAAQIPVEMPWVMTSYWRSPRHMRLLTRWFFPRLAAIYGFTTMPPMPPAPRETEARARSVRQALAMARKHPELVMGLSPEGGDQPSGSLISLPEGVGRFILLLMPHCQKITPVGVFFEGESLVFCFGEAYELHAPAGLTPDERDRWAGEVVMGKIAGLLPGELRGKYEG